MDALSILALIAVVIVVGGAGYFAVKPEKQK